MPRGSGRNRRNAVQRPFAIAINSENLLGDWIYARGGFPLAIIVTTLATTLIVPILRWVPASVTASREGERAVEV